uniref:NADH-ubiquinone oxidoreductase chain 5 n=1 Tax=Onchidella celtica TaxID=36933 RepID=Q6VAQ5_9EUPU|nr:NADH dehydrogenase subunit 5 [Onchidella celtica]AAR21544.2 NADH dehydrogenase subunit 5 [Onchidella celtica]
MLLGGFCVLLWFGFSFFLMGEFTLILEYDLFALSSVVFSFSAVVDKISLSFGAVVTLISACVFTFACKYMEEDLYFYRFIWLLLAFVISMNLLIFSGSLFWLLVGWDGLGITSFALIIYYQSYESLTAGFQTLMVNRIGDSLIVSGTALFVIEGQFTFTSLIPSMGVLVFLLSVAALTKSAQYPFSAWLPAAMAAPTPVSALVHSSTLVTAGIFLVIRLSYNLPLGDSVSTLLLFCGALTCLLGGWAATYENDIKKIIALSTLSQLGVMVFSLGLGSTALALFHLYTHALFKALLFLAAGALLMASFGAQDLRVLGGVGLSMPAVMVMFNLSSLCLVGAPFMSAFYSKHMILEKMFQSGINLVSIILMLVATMMTAKYVSRSLKAVVWSKPVMPGISAVTSYYVVCPMFILGLGGLMGGKLFTSTDPFILECVFIPSVFSSLINIVTGLGLFLGLTMMGLRKSQSLSTLFFLTPGYVYSTKIFAPVSRNLSVLDYGWLEPSFTLSNSFFFITKGWGRVFAWPKSGSSLSRGLVTMAVVFIACSTFI